MSRDNFKLFVSFSKTFESRTEHEFHVVKITKCLKQSILPLCCYYKLIQNVDISMLHILNISLILNSKFCFLLDVTVLSKLTNGINKKAFSDLGEVNCCHLG